MRRFPAEMPGADAVVVLDLPNSLELDKCESLLQKIHFHFFFLLRITHREFYVRALALDILECEYDSSKSFVLSLSSKKSVLARKLLLVYRL